MHSYVFNYYSTPIAEMPYRIFKQSYICYRASQGFMIRK